MKRKAVNSRKKFNNKPTFVDEIRFDSKKEAQRYVDLKWLEKAGQIHNLELQPSFDLMVNGVKVGRYVADFRYLDLSNNETIVEDVKSPATKTPVYRLKKKIMAAQNPPVYVREI